VPYFLGKKQPPAKRIVAVQKVFRATDIDEVGKDGYHQTFFEMLGNFSIGDYGKKEAIEWGWELLTKVFGFDGSKLVATVHTSDDEAYEIWRRVAATGVKNLCAFNYRFVPAIRLAREMIDAGELGEIRHFRGRYLQDWGDDATLDTWRFDVDEAGSGALGDLGTHVIDLARFLSGEIATVSGFVKTFLPARKVDDAIGAAVEFANGAVGTIEATRFALGRRNAFQWEINGSKGSLAFDMERLNELQVFRADGDRARGFKTVLVSEADHPFWEHWWPPGHIIGWGDTFVHELHHMLQAIATDGDVAPYGATFEDGYRASEVGDAIVRSGQSGQRETVSFRSL